MLAPQSKVDSMIREFLNLAGSREDYATCIGALFHLQLCVGANSSSKRPAARADERFPTAGLQANVYIDSANLLELPELSICFLPRNLWNSDPAASSSLLQLRHTQKIATQYSFVQSKKRDREGEQSSQSSKRVSHGAGAAATAVTPIKAWAEYTPDPSPTKVRSFLSCVA